MRVLSFRIDQLDCQRIESALASGNVTEDAPDSMKVGIGISRSIVVEDHVESLDIQSTTKDISADLREFVSELA